VTPASARAAIRVMLVDDHALVRSAVRAALTAPGVEVVAETMTAEAALEAATRLRPDVILLDIDLPGMDGLHLVRELTARLPETRTVMLTVSTADRDVLEAMRRGAAGYLTKDVSPEALLRAVRGVMNGELTMPRKMAARLMHRILQASRHAPTPGDDPALADLTARELEVLRLLAAGQTDRGIAEALTISPRTVESHVGAILTKLGVRNRAEAAGRYREL
jgi:DNA-binding NarL/FixJ family response regulator